jgi:hypothetical protein
MIIQRQELALLITHMMTITATRILESCCQMGNSDGQSEGRRAHSRMVTEKETYISRVNKIATLGDESVEHPVRSGLVRSIAKGHGPHADL